MMASKPKLQPASDLERSLPTPTSPLSLTFLNPLLARTFAPFRQTFMLKGVHFPASLHRSGPGQRSIA